MRVLSFLALLLALAVPSEAARQAGPYHWTGVDRVVAVGDVHGSDKKLTRLLEGTHLIDGEGRWIGGSTHLVAVGDLVDRGTGDRAVMDLLRRLQNEAPEAGGMVHVLVGNHEVMNLVRDLRYVNPDGYASFAADEDSKQRKAALKRFKRMHDGADYQEVFEKEFPPGYFARIEAMDSRGEYGEWLLEQPVIVKINDALFVHGGLTEQVAALGLEGINEQIMSELRDHLRARTRLEARNIVNSMMTFAEAQTSAQRFFDRSYKVQSARSWVETAAKFGELAESPLFGVEGPLWYRGNSLENERIERGRLERTLEQLSARTMVVAHSPTGEKKITSRFGGRLYRVDHGMAYGERPLALVMEDRMALVFDPGDEDLSVPQPELPQGESIWAQIGELTDEEITELLIHGQVMGMRELGRGSTRPKLVELTSGDKRMRAIFKTVDERPGMGYVGAALDRYRQEVAAYRLDRLLGLGLVPVTVLRTLDGAEGSMQQWVEDAVDGETLRNYALAPSDPAKLERQSAVGLAFEYLIGNASRSENDLLYLLEESRVMCVDHSRSFPTGEVEPELPAEIEGRFVEALERLEVSELRDALGELLSEEQIEAVLDRRGRILGFYESGDGSVASGSHAGLRFWRGLPDRAVRSAVLEPRRSRFVQDDPGDGEGPEREAQFWSHEEKEKFLSDAKIVSTKYIGDGITRPKKVKLELDGLTLNAAFKYHEEFRPGVTQFSDGPREVNFRDSYLFDRAAYLLDRELGLDMVPATILRDVEGQEGALIWWVADSMTEASRIEERIMPGDPSILRRQQDAARVFDVLVGNTDDNMNNQLVTVYDWKVHVIDLTRAFRLSKDLPEEFTQKPVTLPRSLHKKLQELEKDRLIPLMKGSLSKAQVRALLARRDAILEKIARDIESNGEDAVFQD